MVRIETIGAEALGTYAAVPMTLDIHTVLDVEPIDRGLGGLLLRERRLPCAWQKDYDSFAEGGPLEWGRQFDLSHWTFFLAMRDGRPVGGATVIAAAPDVLMLDGRTDLALLWDIRVHPDVRREGIGSQLFDRVVSWARDRGFAQLKIETQNVNVAACRFYAGKGAYLGRIDRFGYLGCPPVEGEVMLLWYVDL